MKIKSTRCADASALGNPPSASVSRLHVYITVDVMSIFFRFQISFLHPPRCNTPDSRLCSMNAWPVITEVVHINS